MKKASYFAVLAISLLSSYGFNYGKVLAPIVVDFIKVPSMIGPVVLLFGLPYLLIRLLVVFRIILWIKTRSFAIPQNYSGFTYFAGNITILLIVIPMAFYFYFAVKGTTGVSGIPLALSGVASGFMSLFVILAAEWREFYALIPKRANRNFGAAKK